MADRAAKALVTIVDDPIDSAVVESTSKTLELSGLVTRVFANAYGGELKPFEPPKGTWSNDDVKKNILRGIK